MEEGFTINDLINKVAIGFIIFFLIFCVLIPLVGAFIFIFLLPEAGTPPLLPWFTEDN